MKTLFVVDYHKRAWAIASQGVLDHSEEITGDVASIEDLWNSKYNPAEYDLILLYCWAEDGLADLFFEWRKKTIICVAIGDATNPKTLQDFSELCDGYPHVGANNPYIQNVYTLQFPEKMVLLLSHGVDIKKFSPNKNTHDGFVVGWSGRPDWPIKRLAMSKEIVEGIPGAKLEVAGFHSDKDYPYYEHDQMPKFFNGIDCLLVTSKFESHPLIVYEALACGVPVITTRVGDVADTIINGTNGFLVDPKADKKKFQFLIKHLMNNPKLGEHIGKCARQTIIQRWDWRRIVRQYDRLIGLVKK